MTLTEKATLLSIFNYYKEKYKLSTVLKILFIEQHGNAFNNQYNFIQLVEESIKSNLQDKILLEVCNNISTFLEMAIWCLLHELKHAIDYAYNKKYYQNKLHEYTWLLYFDSSDNENKRKKYIQLTLEKRADIFANMEIKKWV